MSRVGGTLSAPPQGFGKVWEKLTTEELTVAGDVLSATFRPRRFLRVLTWLLSENLTAMNAELIFNNDTGTEYAYRRHENSERHDDGDEANTNDDHIEIDQGTPTRTSFIEMDISDPVGFNKLGFAKTNSTSGTTAGTLPNTQEVLFAYYETTRVTNVTFTQTIGGNSFGIGSRIIVLGIE